MADMLVGRSSIGRGVWSHLCRQLNQFIFANPKVGACYRQLPAPSSNPSERSETTALDDDSSPSKPIVLAIANCKVSSSDWGRGESTGYSVRLLELSKNTVDYVCQLVLPLSSVNRFGEESFKSECVLQLQVERRYEMLVIDIISASGTEEMLKYFCIFHAAVHFLLRNPIHYQSSCVSPTLSLSLESSLTPHGIQSVPDRVFIKGGHVYKLYDTQEILPNLSLVQKVLPEATVVDLSADKRFQYLRYEFRNGSHHPVSCIQFCQVLKQLEQIHDEGFVHADIRDANIVFGRDGESAWIIDLDFAGKENTAYPEMYNYWCDIPERHPEARPGQPKKKIHDVHALSVIAKEISLPIDFVQLYVEGLTLSEIAGKIEQMEKKFKQE